MRFLLIVAAVCLVSSAAVAKERGRSENYGIPSIMVPEGGSKASARQRRAAKTIKVPQTPRGAMLRAYGRRVIVPRQDDGRDRKRPTVTVRRSLEPVTVPAPIAPYTTPIQVPGIKSPGETTNDRIVRCRHYGTALGVPGDQAGVYVHNCAM